MELMKCGTRLEETKQVFAKLPTAAKKKAAAELANRYRQLIGIDTRLERLDRAVAENERRIREITARAQRYAANRDQKNLHDCLKAAQKLQHHNNRLLKLIGHTEARLSAITQKLATGTKEVNRA